MYTSNPFASNADKPVLRSPAFTADAEDSSWNAMLSHNETYARTRACAHVGIAVLQCLEADRRFEGRDTVVHALLFMYAHHLRGVVHKIHALVRDHAQYNGRVAAPEPAGARNISELWREAVAALENDTEAPLDDRERVDVLLADLALCGQPEEFLAPTQKSPFHDVRVVSVRKLIVECAFVDKQLDCVASFLRESHPSNFQDDY